MRHIAISGELGSGKSAVARALSQRLGAAVVSTGAIHRRIAAQRGESALQTNLVAEEDASIDELIDGELVDLAASPDRIIFDSRMAWHFVPDAVTIHLLVDPGTGARRMAGRESTSVEGYADVEEARAHAIERHASEQRRFQSTYEVDIDRLRNYHVVIDTSHAGIAQLATVVAELAASPDRLPSAPHLLVSARRLAAHRHDDVTDSVTRGDDGRVLGSASEAPRVVYCRPTMVVVAGEQAITAAARAGHDLVPAVLAAEADERLADGRSAREVVAATGACSSAITGDD